MRRFALRFCQCGGHAAWRPEKARPRGRAGAQAERLACPVCGNSTGPSSSRSRLADEWNSAGWCGQARRAARAAAPFGEAWLEQVLRLKKPALADQLEGALRRGLHLDGLVARLRGELGERETEIDRLRARRDRRELAEVIDRLVLRGVVAKADAAGAKRKLSEGGERPTFNVQRSTLKGKGGRT